MTSITFPPAPDSIGLALSGGGFRAMLFHLGVLRCLHDGGWLKQVKYITSVSGGSIVAAHVVSRWSQYTSGPEGFNAAAAELLRFARYDVRGRILRRLPFTFLWKNATDHFEGYLRKKLFGDELLAHHCKEGTPDLYILATNSTRGCHTHFKHDEIKLAPKVAIPPSLCRLSLAVTASAAFPGFFPPLKLTAKRLNAKKEELPHPEFFTDGGVWDNLGLRQLTELDAVSPVSIKIVSNARAHFDWEVDTRFSILRNLLRSTDIMMERIRILEQEHADFLDTRDLRLKMVNIFDTVTGVKDALSDNIQRGLPELRTDFDDFRECEIDWLVRHGFAVARKVLELPVNMQIWSPTGGCRTTDEERAQEVKDVAKLKEGYVRRIRLFNPRDWIGWVGIGAICCAVVAGLAYWFPNRLPSSMSNRVFGIHRFVESHLPHKKGAAMVGLWDGTILWSPSWATILIGPPLVPADPQSIGEVTFSIASNSSLDATSHWQLMNGTEAIAVLIVKPVNIVLDERGFVKQFDLKSVVRGTIKDFKYGKFVYYRVRFDLRNPRDLTGKVLCRTNETDQFQEVGDVKLAKR